MPIRSPYPDIDVQTGNLLDYVFPAGTPIPDTPFWFDAADPSVNVSRAQAMGWIKRLGFGLDRCLKRGDGVMVLSPAQVYIPAVYFGIIGAGYSYTGGNPLFTVPELVRQMKDVDAKLILVHPAMLAKAIAAAKEIGLPESSVYQVDDKECAIKDGVQDWRALAGSETEGASWDWPKFSPEESRSTVAVINYSSGTTGPPKGVMISHSNLISNCEQMMVGRYGGVPADAAERWICFMPLAHAYGQLYTCIMAVLRNAPVYLMKAFSFTEWMKNIQQYKITELHLAPPILLLLSKSPETKKYDLSSVKTVLCGAAPLSKELQNDCRTRLGWHICQGFGMSEITGGGMSLPSTSADETGSVGVLTASVDAKIVDDDGNEVKIGERGELYLRGPMIFMGYKNNPEATKETLLEDGWMKTGDTAVCNEEGLFWIVDRKKELIKVLGLQVAPAEIEAELIENEHVADAGVVGYVADNLEFPKAYIVLKQASKGHVTPEEIQEWIKTRLSEHKWLTGGVTFVDAIPKNPSGKIQRKLIREWAQRDGAGNGAVAVIA